MLFSHGGRGPEMLDELPEKIQEICGGGMSFLNASCRRSTKIALFLRLFFGTQLDIRTLLYCV